MEVNKMRIKICCYKCGSEMDSAQILNSHNDLIFFPESCKNENCIKRQEYYKKNNEATINLFKYVDSLE